MQMSNTVITVTSKFFRKYRELLLLYMDYVDEENKTMDSLPEVISNKLAILSVKTIPEGFTNMNFIGK